MKIIKRYFYKITQIMIVVMILFSTIYFSALNQINADDSYSQMENMKFSDYNGYTVEYLLKNYNVVSFQDTTMNAHCMGGILIHGDLKGNASGYADIGTLEAPSYVSGSLKEFSGWYNSRNGNVKTPLYIGSVNKIRMEYGNTFINDKYSGQSPAYHSDDFVDWDRLSRIIKETSVNLKKKSTKTIDITKNYEMGTPLEIEAGSNVTLRMNGHYVHIRLIGEISKNKTIINLEGNEVSIPRIVNELSNAENGKGTSIVWNCPNVKSVNILSALSPEVGHVIALDANLKVESCNYNGCLISQKATIDGEGHFHPYDGDALLTEKTVSKTITKIWDDNNNQDGLRPSHIIVQLKANGEDYDLPVKITADEKGNWTYTWKNLPDNAVYTVEELNIDENYEVSYEGDTIINTYKLKTRTISVEKVWNDNDDQSRIRPDHVIIRLYANGKQTGQYVELNEDNQWKAEFSNLPVNQNGKKIEYTVMEDHVDRYITEITESKDGFVITNTMRLTQFVIYKVNQDGIPLYGASFELDKVIDGEEIFIDEQQGGPTFVFDHLDDGIYRIYETVVPDGYIGMEDYFEIEIKDGLIYYDNQLETEGTFVVYNTRNDMDTDVLGDEIIKPQEKIDSTVLGHEIDSYRPSVLGNTIQTNKKVKTSDSQELSGYIILTMGSAICFCFLKKKEFN